MDKTIYVQFVHGFFNGSNHAQFFKYSTGLVCCVWFGKKLVPLTFFYVNEIFKHKLYESTL